MNLDHDDLTLIQHMIDTAVQSVPQTNRGLTRNGTVQSYNPDTLAAGVLLDGDSAAVPVANNSGVRLLATGQRVVVMFQDPQGGGIIGPAASLPVDEVFTDVPNASPEVDFVAGATAGPYTLGTYHVPADGFGIVILTVQGHFNAAGVQEVVMSSADGDMFSPGQWTSRSEGGTGFARTNLTGQFLKVLTKGEVWAPKFQVVVGGGTPAWHLNMYVATVIYTPSPHHLT